MAKQDVHLLLPFLEPFDPGKRDLVLWLRDFAWDLCPTANELIYDNYNAVALGWSPTDRQSQTACTLSIGRTSMNVLFGFYWGTSLQDPNKVLRGGGNQFRSILVTDLNTFPKRAAEQLVHEAYTLSLSKVKDSRQLMVGQTIVKSISANKRVK